MDDAPRMRMVVPVPAVPDCEVRATPGTRDCSRFATLVIGASAMTPATETEETSAACALRSRLPAVPVTTISERVTSDDAIWRFAVTVWFATTRTVSETALYPIR